MKQYLYNMFFWQILWIQEKITDLALWIIRKVNKGKNRCLSYQLLMLSDDYCPRNGQIRRDYDACNRSISNKDVPMMNPNDVKFIGVEYIDKQDDVKNKGGWYINFSSMEEIDVSGHADRFIKIQNIPEINPVTVLQEAARLQCDLIIKDDEIKSDETELYASWRTTCNELDNN